MKYIITLLLLVFSASVLDARSVKLIFMTNLDEEVFTIQIIDSKTKDKKTHKILIDNEFISVSKNKVVMQKIADYLDGVMGDQMYYPWNKKEVFYISDIIYIIEGYFIWGNYQVSRYTTAERGGLTIRTFYFYKPD